MKVIQSLIGILFIVQSSSSLSLETDNYLVWDKSLFDSSEKINWYVNDQITKTLTEVNSFKKPKSCKELTLSIAKKFKTSPPHTHPLEDWLNENLTDEYIFPNYSFYRSISIYQDEFRFYLSKVKLAQNIQVSNIYFGTDKLSHFVSTGRRYYRYYMKRVKKLGHEEALKSAIRFGLLNEKTILGGWSSGVFSYGDMEANYQGLNFYLKLCSNNYKKTYISKNKSGEWVQIRKFKIEEYVNPRWDETFNPSYRVKNNWKKTEPMIRNLYCQTKGNENIIERFTYYESIIKESESSLYIKNLMKEKSKKAPVPQADKWLHQVCDN